MISNSSFSPLELLTANSSPLQQDGAVAFPKDSFSNALTKNIVAMLVWLTLNVINGSMVYTFMKHRIFYEDPRYIMFIYMVVNDAMQLSLVTALYVVSYVFRQIHAAICCILVMTAVLTTRSTPLILAGMSLERYLSICHPLHYGHICTMRRTFMLIWVILLLTAAPPLTDLFITLAKEPQEFFHSSMFCDQSLLFRDRSIYYKNCVFDGSYLSFVALTLLYTYCKIMMAAQAASTTLASVKRARNTVLLHGAQLLLCLLAFVVPSLQAALISLFPHMSREIRYVFFLLVYIIPRFLSPIIYGFRDENFSRYWIRYLTCRRRLARKVRPLLSKVIPKVKKARNTILLHGVQLLIRMLSYFSPILTMHLMKRYPTNVRSVLYVTFLFTNILSRLLSPLIYGVRDQKFSTQLRLVWLSRGPRQGERLRPAAGERVRPTEGERGRSGETQKI